MTEFSTRVCGIPCIVRVLEWEAFVPMRTSGHPDNWMPEEGGHGSWELLDTRGRPAPWLERKMKQADIDALSNEVYDQMESDRDYF
jgi:hypothetical protein